MTYELGKQITEIEHWLREHPNAEPEIKHDMINRLENLKTKQDQIQRQIREQKTFK